MLEMDEKYNKIALELKKRLAKSDKPKSSSGSSLGSAKSSFSNKSKEDAFNAFMMNSNSPESPPAKPPKPPKKLSPIKSKKTLDLKMDKPLTFLSGQPTAPTTAEEINFFATPPRLSLPKPIGKLKGGISDPADLTDDWYMMLNKNTPTDPKYRKKQLKLLAEEFSESAYETNEVIGDPYGKYNDPERLNKAKKLIDERLRRWLGRKDDNVPAKYTGMYGVDFVTDNYNQDYFDSSSSEKKSSPPAKKSSPPAKKSASPPAKQKTPEKKKRGRPLGSKNKPKPPPS